MIETVSAVADIKTIVFNGGREFEELLDIAYEKVDGDYENKIIELFNASVLRNNNYKDTNGRPTVDMSPTLVVLNDYEKIKGGLSEDGKDKLITILDKVEGFCNIYFVVCDSYRSVNQYYMDKWMGSRCSGEGVWVGNGIENQIRLTITRRTKELEREIDRGAGFYVAGGYARLMRLVMPSKLEGVIDDDE